MQFQGCIEMFQADFKHFKQALLLLHKNVTTEALRAEGPGHLLLQAYLGIPAAGNETRKINCLKTTKIPLIPIRSASPTPQQRFSSHIQPKLPLFQCEAFPLLLQLLNFPFSASLESFQMLEEAQGCPHNFLFPNFFSPFINPVVFY